MKRTENKKRKPSAKAFLAALIAVCFAGNIGIARSSVHASASEYSLAGSTVTIDGTKDGSAKVALKTSKARNYVAIQAAWSLHEINSGSSQTSYLSLSGMTRGGSTNQQYGENGVTSWAAEDENGISVAANGGVLTATYKVDKNTPEGTYQVSLSNGLFTYHINGADVDEDDTINLNATVTVKRGEPNSDNSNDEGNTDNNGDEGTPIENNSEDNSDEGSKGDPKENPEEDPEDDSEFNPKTDLAVPDTGYMSQDDNGAKAVIISIASIAAVAALIIVAVKTKTHKKIKFD